MNINYAQIIELANARKDALEAFASRMKEAPEQVQKLKDALLFFGRLNDDLTRLDAEALQMVNSQAEAARTLCFRTQELTNSLSFAHAGYSQSTAVKFLSACKEFK